MDAITGFAEVNGARLYYESMGAGFPVVFVHAGVADHRMWDGQFAVFAEKYRVIRYDMRGFGDSPAPKGPFSFHADLYGLLQQLGVERAALVGCSMGGMTIIDFALEHPEMTAALVPVGSGLSGGKYDGPPPPLSEELEAAEKALNFDLAAAYAVRIWVDGRKRAPNEVNPAIRAKVQEMTRRSYESPPDYDRYQELDPPAAARLDQLSMPVLTIVGDLDTQAVLQFADQLAAGAPNARKVILIGTAHLPNMERPEDFNAVVLGWLDGVLE